MAQYHARHLESEGVIVEVKQPNESDWTFVPGVTAWSVSGGAAPTREVEDLHGVDIVTGRSRPEGVTFTLSSLQVNHGAFDRLWAAKQGDSELHFRWRQPKEKVLVAETTGTTTLAIDTAGSVTKGAGTDHPNLNNVPGLGPSAQIKIGTAYYGIDEVPTNGDIGGVTIRTSSRPSADVAASVYSIVVAPYYQPQFLARVIEFPWDGASSSAVSGSVTLAPANYVPAPKTGTP